MTQPENAPLLAENKAVAGMVFVRSEDEMTQTVDRQQMGITCIELIAQLENVFAKARELPVNHYIDESSETSRSMLKKLESFISTYMKGQVCAQATEELSKAMTTTYAFDEVLKTRPLGNLLMRTFWKAEETADIKRSHDAMGQGLVRAIAATMYHAIMTLGFETEMGREIDQSTVVFVTELSQTWS